MITIIEEALLNFLHTMELFDLALKIKKHIEEEKILEFAMEKS